jgi:hypothetical protein
MPRTETDPQIEMGSAIELTFSITTPANKTYEVPAGLPPLFTLYREGAVVNNLQNIPLADYNDSGETLTAAKVVDMTDTTIFKRGAYKGLCRFRLEDEDGNSLNEPVPVYFRLIHPWE